MTYGTAMHGSNRFVIQYTPHVGLYTIILGVLIYPVRYVWVPLLLFCTVLVLPVSLPWAQTHAWELLLTEHFEYSLVVMAANAVCGVLVGLIATVIHTVVQRHLTPYSGDLVLAFLTQAAFFVATVVMLHIFDAYQAALPTELQTLLGYDADYLELGFMRLLRGCTVMLVFALVFLHRPKSTQWILVLPVVFAFAVLALLHHSGIEGFRDLDSALLAMLFSLVLPGAIAPLALTIGVGLHSVFTGTYLTDAVYLTPAENLLNIYSVIVLAFVGFILAYRGSVDHRNQTNASSIARLDAARDFAGLGAFVVNQTTGYIYLDPAARRVMDSPTDFLPVFQLYESFSTDSRGELLRMGIVEPGESEGLLLNVDHKDGSVRTIRVLVWAERAESGAKLAYGLVLDVTDEHERQDALEKALRVLEDKDEKQRRMFSIISHELRTPASIISMLVEDLTPANAEQRKSQLAESTDQLLNVLSDMRQAVNPEQNLVLSKDAYKPHEMAESIRNEFQFLAEKHDMQIILTMGQDAWHRRTGDRTRVKQLVGNLVRNALIHSRGTNVQIGFHAYTREDGQPMSRWIVRDDGIGVPPNEVTRLFEPFERGTADPRTQADGSGLGLYIAKMTAELLGGSIQYIDTGQGACYQVSLPENIASEIEAPTIPKPTVEASLASLDVLLAEDNAVVAEVTKARFAKVFRSVRIAKNGSLAIAAIKENPPDVLVTDLFMPETDGDELVRNLREQGYSFPMIGLTAAVVGNDVDRFHEAGADAVFSKPVKMEDLNETLFALLNKAKEQK